MQDPTFRLEGVVRSSNELEDFEGPLTLILQLLSKNKIEIQDIRISDLLDQYMAWMAEMKAMDLEIASEFVAMASHLVYIKARMLLSAQEEPSELEELIKSLERLQRRDVYERIRAVAPSLAGYYTRGAGFFVKPPEPLPVKREYRYVHDKLDLMNAMLRVLRQEAGAPLGTPAFTMPNRIVYPVTEKSDELLSWLTREGETPAETFFRRCASRSELVATFVALLELCREGKIALIGEGEDMTVAKLTEWEVKPDAAPGS